MTPNRSPTVWAQLPDPPPPTDPLESWPATLQGRAWKLMALAEANTSSPPSAVSKRWGWKSGGIRRAPLREAPGRVREAQPGRLPEPRWAEPSWPTSSLLAPRYPRYMPGASSTDDPHFDKGGRSEPLSASQSSANINTACCIHCRPSLSAARPYPAQPRRLRTSGPLPNPLFRIPTELAPARSIVFMEPGICDASIRTKQRIIAFPHAAKQTHPARCSRRLAISTGEPA